VSLMFPTKVPQRVVLRQMLDCGKLTSAETKTVGKLFDDLSAGRIGGLNTQQSAWVEQVCKRCGIAVERAKPPPRKKKDETKKLVADFDAMPRPKKPPGRK
jgi:hypothetical protein